MSGIRYPEEFKIEAVKQVTDRGYNIGEVAKRLGVTPKSMHDWIKKYGDTGSQHQTITGQQDELRQLKAQLRRVTEERDILKEVKPLFYKGFVVTNSLYRLNRPQFARHFSVIQNDYERGEYEQEAISRRV